MDICHLCFIHLLYVLAEAAQRGGSTRRGEVHGGRPGVTEVSAFKSALLQNAQKTLFCGEGCKRGTRSVTTATRTSRSLLKVHLLQKHRTSALDQPCRTLTGCAGLCWVPGTPPRCPREYYGNYSAWVWNHSPTNCHRVQLVEGGQEWRRSKNPNSSVESDVISEVRHQCDVSLTDFS